MRRGIQGRYVTISTAGENVQAFVPATLPPEPPIAWSTELQAKFDRALHALGQLDSVASLLPETSLFLYTYVRKEAVLSSMIEGTQSSLSDLLLFELDQLPGVPLDDVREVSRYVAALEHGLQLMHDGLPLSMRLLREVHKVLLSKGRGNTHTPGEYRRSQNWIGGSRPGNATFVPPPAAEVQECLSNMERFLHDDPLPTPVLVKAALAHVQFETIHPFLDGNGRLGRLLITLLLCNQQVLRKPLLYLSLYFKTHRRYYYTLLDNVRLTGDWESWLDFFADAVITTATQAVNTAQRLHQQALLDRALIEGLGKAAASAVHVHRALMKVPIATSNSLVVQTGLTPATVNRSLEHLVNLGIVSKITPRQRNRVFGYTSYLTILNAGTELPDSIEG